MPTAAELVNAGYTGYQGWDDAGANADFNAGHGNDKLPNGGSSGSGTPPPFSFDYAAEATKAYGELGPYYTRLLSWAQGDMNKVLTRLTEDYDKGLRVKTEDTALGKTKIDQSQGQADIAEANTKENIKNNLLARGLYNKSLDDPNAVAPETGFGIGDVDFRKTNQNFNFQKDQRQQAKTALDTSLSRYKENADLLKARTTADQTEAEKRKEFSLDEERKTRSGDIANERGSRAYQDYVNKFSLG